MKGQGKAPAGRNIMATTTKAARQTAAERAAPAKIKAPSVATMTRWISNGRAKATDGCWTDADGTCEHGRSSWVLALGYI